NPLPAPYLGGMSGARSGGAVGKVHANSICTRVNPIKTTKTGRRVLAPAARARVRHPSNMGPTFNAMDPRGHGALALTPRTPSPTALSANWPSYQPAPPHPT